MVEGFAHTVGQLDFYRWAIVQCLAWTKIKPPSLHTVRQEIDVSVYKYIAQRDVINAHT